jgi:hypothetical protein
MDAPAVATTDFFAYLLRYPVAVESVTATLLRHAEIGAILRNAREGLWQGLLHAPEPVASLSRVEKRALIIQAGLLRGFNMALIVAWRPTGDSLVDLESFYPGFTAYAIAFARSHADDQSDDDAADDDSRAVVHAFEQDAKRLLRLGLSHGYGLGMLISDALDADAAGAGAAVGGPATLPVISRDDPVQAQICEGWIEALGRDGLHAAVGDLLSDQSTNRIIEGALTTVSRQHPLAVPETMERFSDAFVVEMLAFLLRWWADVGLRCRLQTLRGGASLPSGRQARERYRVGAWLSAYTRDWATGELDDIRASMADATELRVGLVQRARLAVAFGILIGHAVDRRGGG